MTHSDDPKLVPITIDGVPSEGSEGYADEFNYRSKDKEGNDIDIDRTYMRIDAACTLIKQALSLNYKTIAEISRISVNCLSRWRNKVTVHDPYTWCTDELNRFVQLYDIALGIKERYGLLAISNPYVKRFYHSSLPEHQSIYECLIMDEIPAQTIYNIIELYYYVKRK